MHWVHEKIVVVHCDAIQYVDCLIMIQNLQWEELVFSGELFQFMKIKLLLHWDA